MSIFLYKKSKKQIFNNPTRSTETCTLRKWWKKRAKAIRHNHLPLPIYTGVCRVLTYSFYNLKQTLAHLQIVKISSKGQISSSINIINRWNSVRRSWFRVWSVQDPSQFQDRFAEIVALRRAWIVSLFINHSSLWTHNGVVLISIRRNCKDHQFIEAAKKICCLIVFDIANIGLISLAVVINKKKLVIVYVVVVVHQA